MKSRGWSVRISFVWQFCCLATVHASGSRSFVLADGCCLAPKPMCPAEISLVFYERTL